MNNNNFTVLNESELYDTQGGFVWEVVAAVAAIIGVGIAAYGEAKNDAYKSGVQQTNQHINGKKCTRKILLLRVHYKMSYIGSATL